MQRLQALQAGFMAKGFLLAVAKQQALSIIDKIVQGQAAILAFEDILFIVGIFFIFALPLLLLFEKPKIEKPEIPHMIAE